MVRYIVIDFVKKRIENSPYFQIVETQIEAKDRKEAAVLLEMTDSPSAYILDKANKKRIVK